MLEGAEPVADHEEVQWLIDRMRIADCLGRYVRGLDRHDADLIASAFWPDAHIRYGARYDGPLGPFVEWSNASHAERWTGHSHNVTNQIVTFEPDRSAADVETYILFFHRREGTVDVGVGRYLDRLVKREGEWRILYRRLVADMMFETKGFDFTASGFPVGRWLPDDPSYVRPYGPLAPLEEK